MKPIYKQPFPKKLFGYDPKSVDKFIELMAKEFERVLKENEELKKQK